MMRMKPQNLPSQQAEPEEYSKYRRSSRYTLWKARRARFCHISLLLQRHVCATQIFAPRRKPIEIRNS